MTVEDAISIASSRDVALWGMCPDACLGNGGPNPDSLRAEALAALQQAQATAQELAYLAGYTDGNDENAGRAWTSSYLSQRRDAAYLRWRAQQEPKGQDNE
jgi:hypothetical protein